MVVPVLSENAAALPLHFFAHSLNLCLQDAGRQIRICVMDLKQLEKWVNSSSFFQSEPFSFHKSCLKMKIPRQPLKHFVPQDGQLGQEP